MPNKLATPDSPGFSQGINYIDNPGFEINQRGQASYTDDGVLTLDRWILNNPSESSIVSQDNGNNSTYSLKFVQAGANDSVFQNIDYNYVVNQLKGKWVTFACDVKYTGSNNVKLVLYDNVGLVYSQAHSGGGDWERLTLSAQISASTSVLIVFIASDTPSGTDTIYIDNAMLVEGKCDKVPYVPFDSSEELERCYRYYQTGHYINGSYGCDDGSQFFHQDYVQYSIPMASTTTVTLSNYVVQLDRSTNNDEFQFTKTVTADGVRGFDLLITDSSRTYMPNLVAFDWISSINF